MRTIALMIALLASVGALAQVPNGPSQGNTESQQMAATQAKMKEMQGLMDRMHATQNHEERERLMDEHMKAMTEAMSMMDKMTGQDASQRRQCAPADSTCRMDQMKEQQGMMGQRMDMMQMMMHQMMGRMDEQSQEHTPTPRPNEAPPSGEGHAEHH